MKNILVAVDFSDLTERILETTIEIARPMKAKVWLLNCIEKLGFVYSSTDPPVSFAIPRSHLPEAFPNERQQLVALSHRLRELDIDSEILFVNGETAEEILNAVQDNRIDLIIMGSHGHGAIYDLIMGSVTKSIIYYTKTPTLIVPCPGKQPTETFNDNFLHVYSSVDDHP